MIPFKKRYARRSYSASIVAGSFQRSSQANSTCEELLNSYLWKPENLSPKKGWMKWLRMIRSLLKLSSLMPQERLRHENGYERKRSRSPYRQRNDGSRMA